MTISEMRPLQPPLAAVRQLLECFGNQGVIVDGVAASVLGTPRLTADVDVVLLLSVSRLPELLDVAAELGLVPYHIDVHIDVPRLEEKPSDDRPGELSELPPASCYRPLHPPLPPHRIPRSTIRPPP